MSFQTYLPIWDQLQPHQQRRLLASLTKQAVERGTLLRGGSTDCTGVLLIRTGQLNWPVFALGAAGAILVILGGIVLLKKRKNA